MAPSAKVAKGVKSNDLRMFFGPGGSKPKHVPAVQVGEARFSIVLQVNRRRITEEERAHSR